jgi:hypothetical protein
MKKYLVSLLVLFVAFPGIHAQKVPGQYKNFKVAIYARAYEVKQMSDLKKLDSTWTAITQQLKVDKIYLETHRDTVMVDAKTIEAVKKYFLSKGVQVAGGITYTWDERNHFQTFCYTNPDQRKATQEIAEFTARHFDEFILDDFFFTNCKCDLCIKAKGDQSWTQYRLNLMNEAARDLIVNPAKAVNPKVKVVIKYPNWYEHFQGLGFNLESEPAIFDGIYTGNETRDPVLTNQHLQQYESYEIFRYFENIAPGRNGGGWVDPFASFYLDRYAEQLWNTLFAKAPEITLFDFRMMESTINPATRGTWQGIGTSFDFDEMMKPIQLANEQTVNPSTLARACGVVFEQVDKFLGELGNPVGIKSYKPFHSTGEDFIHNYFGMIGLPIELLPEYPTGQKMILLTEAAAFDKDIVKKIETSLAAGNNVIITSGLLRALQGKGIEDIVEMKYTDRNIEVKDFVIGMFSRCQSEESILYNEIEYLTNDSWEDISSIRGASGCPVLLQAQYSKGSLFVLNIPENYSDLYLLPELVLNRIREVASQDLNIRIEGPAQVGLFDYDNGTFIVESYLPDPVKVKVILNKPSSTLIDILSKESISGTAATGNRIWGRETPTVTSFEVELKPHSYRVFKEE